jgi:hypothetical protein
MPRFYFDLFIDKCVVLDPGGMLLAGPAVAMSAADDLANHVFVSRTDLRDRGSWIRVRDHRGFEICRSIVDRKPPVEATSDI